MGWFTGVVVYLMIWWLVLFMVLPWGIQPAEVDGTGNMPGAPAKPRLKLKFLITTGIAAIVWAVVFVLIKMDLIDFYAISEQMMREDGL